MLSERQLIEYLANHLCQPFFFLTGILTGECFSVKANRSSLGPLVSPHWPQVWLQTSSYPVGFSMRYQSRLEYLQFAVKHQLHWECFADRRVDRNVALAGFLLTTSSYWWQVQIRLLICLTPTPHHDHSLPSVIHLLLLCFLLIVRVHEAVLWFCYLSVRSSVCLFHSLGGCVVFLHPTAMGGGEHITFLCNTLSFNIKLFFL